MVCARQGAGSSECWTHSERFRDAVSREASPAQRTGFGSPQLILTKQDADDFDRDEVTELINIFPTETSGPRLSPGRVAGSIDPNDMDKQGLTPIGSGGRVVINAFWSFDMPLVSSFSVEEPLHMLEKVLFGKELLIKNICGKYNLSASLTVKIYADPYDLPIIGLPAESVKFWAAMGAEIDFCLTELNEAVQNTELM